MVVNERGAVKERARSRGERGVMGWRGDSLSLSFSSFSSSLALSSVTLLAFRPPRAIQIETTRDESGLCVFPAPV